MVFKASVREGPINVDDIFLRIRMASVKAIREKLDPVKSDIKKELSRPKSGQLTTRYSPKRQLRPSIPGEAPAKDLGDLLNSVFTAIQTDKQTVSLQMGASAEHAAYLEDGTTDESGAPKMLPRPFLRPALKRWEEKVVDDLIKEIRGGL